MNRADRDAYRARYNARLKQYGRKPETLGWTKGRQRWRFEVLTSFVDLGAMKSILDVGCGFGDLGAYLTDVGFRGRYRGIDIVPELVAEARAAHPGADLGVADLAEIDPAESFDLVLACGVFSAALGHEDRWQNVQQSVVRMFSVARYAAVVDFLSAYADERRDDLYYAEPESVFRLARTLTRRVSLRHDYLPFEFAVCLYRRDAVTSDSRFPPAHGHAHPESEVSHGR